MSTEIVPTEQDEQALATFAIAFPQYDVADVADIMRLALVPGVMREKSLKYEAALKHIGLNPRTVLRWRQARPYIFLISAQLALTRLEPEIDAMLAEARPEIIKGLIRDAKSAVAPKDRRAAAAYLERLYYGPMDASIDHREQEVHDKTGEGAVKRRVMRKFDPVRLQLNVLSLEIGRQSSNFSDAVDGEFEEEE